MDFHKLRCSCLRIVVIFLALSTFILISSDAIRAGGESEKGCGGDGLAEAMALPMQGRLLPASSRDRKKLLEVREVIGTIKADYPGSEAKRQAIPTP